MYCIPGDPLDQGIFFLLGILQIIIIMIIIIIIIMIIIIFLFFIFIYYYLKDSPTGKGFPDRGGLQVYSTSLHHKNQTQINKEKKEKNILDRFGQVRTG